jgi:hypothetical protein
MLAPFFTKPLNEFQQNWRKVIASATLAGIPVPALRLGTHPVQLHSPDHAFTVTAFTRNHSLYRKHLDILLTHTNLKAIQWINLNHSRIEITTLEKDGKGMGARE